MTVSPSPIVTKNKYERNGTFITYYNHLLLLPALDHENNHKEIERNGTFIMLTQE